MKISRSNEVRENTKIKNDNDTNIKNKDLKDILQSSTPEKEKYHGVEMDFKMSRNISKKEDVMVSDFDFAESTTSSSFVYDESDDNKQFENWKNLADKPFQENLTSNKTERQIKRWPKYKDSCPDIRRFLNKSG